MIVDGTAHEVDRVVTLEELNDAFNKGLIELFQAVFADPPYEESFTADEVREAFELYYTEGVLLLSRAADQSVNGFAASIPLVLEAQIAALAEKFGMSAEDTWYFADLGVAHASRGQGLATALVLGLIGQTPADTMLMRTSEDNVRSLAVNKKVGFVEVDGMEQFVEQQRQDGSVKKDRRIFLRRDAVAGETTNVAD